MESPLSQYKKPIIYAVLCAVLVVVFVRVFDRFVAPPVDFPAPYHFTIDRGQTLFSLSRELADARVISSPRLFEIFIITFSNMGPWVLQLTKSLLRLFYYISLIYPTRLVFVAVTCL